MIGDVSPSIMLRTYLLLRTYRYIRASEIGIGIVLTVTYTCNYPTICDSDPHGKISGD